MPNRRNNGSGGHQPCKACWSRNAATATGSAKKRRSTDSPSADAQQRHRSRIRFEGALDVPFALQLRRFARR